MRRQRWAAYVFSLPWWCLCAEVPQRFYSVLKAFSLDDAQSGLWASWSYDGARINYRPSAQEFLILIEENVQRFRNFLVVTGWKYARKCRSLPSGHSETQGCSVQSPQLSSSCTTAASPLISFILHQMSASAAFHIYGCFRVSFTHMFLKEVIP